jgi:hypothetical protein
VADKNITTLVETQFNPIKLEIQVHMVMEIQVEQEINRHKEPVAAVPGDQERQEDL